MNTTKIVFTGAGSTSFGLNMFKDIFTSQELAGSTLSLVDLDKYNLARMTDLARLMNEHFRTNLKIESTTELRKVLPEADFVINSVAIDRNRLWKLDFQIPKKYGIRHTLGENGGPGGLFFTLRTLPLIFDFIHNMEELCPHAIFINFSNPESRIILAIGKYSSIRCIGLCHGIFMAQNDIARMLGLSREKVDVWGAGLNHFQWLLEIKNRETGEDLYPVLREKEETYNPDFMPLTRRLFRAFGKYPSCSDDHIGEYLAFGWEGGVEGYDFEADERHRQELKIIIEAVLAGKNQLPQEWMETSGERGVAVITGILHNQKKTIESGVIYNLGAIPNLPDDLAVEVPVVVDRAGVHPVSLGPLPDGIAKLLLMQASVQQLSVEAAMQGSKELALQALLIDPVVNSAVAAEKILDELWEINKPYIRRCV
ncbi:MAG TPA: alpha-glucosidase/alpha-galactosidase [Anaerolineales bacterium]|nr:alpha-glucosidase/alpha-galactosidase [Anaerolineales bacterium]